MTQPKDGGNGTRSGGPATPPAGHGQGGRQGWHRPSVNITPIERGGRVAIGLAAVIVAVVLLAAAASALAVVLEALLIAAGLDLVVTGALGHCPLYQRLGHMPRSLRRPV
jgi:hypothetical protein